MMQLSLRASLKIKRHAYKSLNIKLKPLLMQVPNSLDQGKYMMMLAEGILDHLLVKLCLQVVMEISGADFSIPSGYHSDYYVKLTVMI